MLAVCLEHCTATTQLLLELVYELGVSSPEVGLLLPVSLQLVGAGILEVGIDNPHSHCETPTIAAARLPGRHARTQ